MIKALVHTEFYDIDEMITHFSSKKYTNISLVTQKKKIPLSSAIIPITIIQKKEIIQLNPKKKK